MITIKFEIDDQSIIEAGYDPANMTKEQEEDFKFHLEQLVESDLPAYIRSSAEYACLPEIIEFNDNDVYETMFEYDYGDLRDDFLYDEEDIDICELHDFGQTIWRTFIADYKFTMEISNVIKITMSNVKNPDEYVESCAYEEGNINNAIAVLITGVLEQYKNEYLK